LTYCIIFDNDKIDLKKNSINLYFNKIIFIDENDSKNLKVTINNILKSVFTNGFMKNVKIKAGHHFDSNDACITSMMYQIIFELFNADKLSMIQTKQDFISFCKEYKRQFDNYDIDHLKTIEQETLDDKFTGDNLINWYTKESYFYSLLNNTLRENNITSIFRIRYIIQEMKNALLKFKVTEKDRPEMLYRASLIHEDEIKLLSEPNVGDKKIIQFSGFNSCTPIKENIIYIAGQNFSSKNQNQKSIVYRINIDEKHDDQMFNIKEVSELKIEEEILVNYDSYIKIDSIEESKDKYIDYYINCSFSDFDEIIPIIDPITLNIKETFSMVDVKYNIDNFYLADLFVNLWNFKELENLLERTDCNEDLDICLKLYFTGVLYMNQGKHSESLEHFESFLSISKNFKEILKDKIFLCKNHILYRSLHIGEFSELQTLTDFLSDNKIPYFLINIIEIIINFHKNQNIEELKKNIDKILLNMEKDEINRKDDDMFISFRSNYIDLLSCLSNLSKGNSSESLKYLLKFRTSIEKFYGTNFIFKSFLNKVEGIIKYNNGLNSNAENYSDKFSNYIGLNIDTNFENALIYYQKGKDYKDHKKYPEALVCFQDSKNLFLQQKNTFNFTGIQLDYLSEKEIADIYFEQNKYLEASEIYHSIINHFEKLNEIDNIIISESYKKLAYIYSTYKNYFEALKYLEKLLIYEEKELGLDNENTLNTYKYISILYEILGNEYLDKLENKKALKHYDQSLLYLEKTRNFDIKLFENIYDRISRVFNLQYQILINFIKPIHSNY